MIISVIFFLKLTLIKNTSRQFYLKLCIAYCLIIEYILISEIHVFLINNGLCNFHINNYNGLIVIEIAFMAHILFVKHYL